MGIYSIYFGRINSMDNFLIGTPILNRTNFAQKHTSGMFISTSLLKIDTSKNLPFIEFLKQKVELENKTDEENVDKKIIDNIDKILKTNIY